MRHHTIHSAHHHWSWDHTLDPVCHVAPGATIRLGLNDPGGGQLSPHSCASDLLALNFGQVNPVTGPVWIDSAEPGDVLRVDVLDVDPCGWGWSAVIPGFGLLAEDFPEPYFLSWHYDRTGQVPAASGEPGRIPLRPMIGAMGVAPAEAGTHDILPPRRVGGTMDIRDVVTGATVYLPVEVPGALLSCGDGHAAQGDGEVCGTGIETALSVLLRVDVIKNMSLPGPQLHIPGSVMSEVDVSGYDVTTGVGPDLMEGARDAVRAMIDVLCQRENVTPSHAYVLCSVAAHLRISEIVDAPNWIVSLYFPRSVLK